MIDVSTIVTSVASILIAGSVTGVTFIAYKHPTLYEEAFALKLMRGAGAVAIGCAVYDAGASAAFQALSPLLLHDKLNEATELLKGAKSPTWLYMAAFGVIIYSFFLSWLADHFKREHERNGGDT